MLRIGLLTSGGDCQALNATMRGIVKTLMTNSEEPIEIYGFEDGYQGLIYSRFRVMTPADFSGILTRGGTILGTSRTPFKRLDTPEADGVEKVPAMVHTYHKLQLDCLFMLGGNGSTKTANRLREEGLNVIALPKTIDHHDAVYNLARAALLAGSLTTGKLENLDVATGDCLHQPYRFSLIENGEDIVREAKELGALGAFISGAGPSIVAIVYKGDRDYIEKAQALCETKYPHWKAVQLRCDEVGTTVKRL